MSEVMLKAKSPFVSLLQLLQGSQSLYDIVAACYHIIFVYQHDHELEFINEIDKLADKGSKNNACFNDLEQFRTKMDFLISDVYDESETLLFLNELCELLSHLTCPPRTEKNTFVSFCAFYIIEVIDFYLESGLLNGKSKFPDCGPLNKNVCVEKCCVYFHETDSFLSNIYRSGRNGFRKPLHGFRLGSIFRRLLMFERIEFVASPPRIVPVFMTDSDKQQFKLDHRLRIASIPFIGDRTFDFYEVKNNKPCEGAPDGAFYVRYNECKESKCIQAMIQLLDKAIENKTHIVVFPEYVMSPGMLDAIRKYLREKYFGTKQPGNQLLLVLAGTNYVYDDSGTGNNIMHILVGDGHEIGRYYKYSPFLTQCRETVHGGIYGETVDYDKRRYLHNLEIISNQGGECTLIDLNGVGRILPSICRDVIDGNYTDTLAKLFAPSLLLIPAWSASTTSFNSRLSVLAETIHTTSLLCNCCNAVDEKKHTIGKFVYPTKQDSEMVARIMPLNRECSYKKECINVGGCMHLVDLDFGGSELNVSQKNILVDMSKHV